ncbi:MAG: malto-oligosyltrehalose synthase [Acidobacteriaceae bacterium]
MNDPTKEAEISRTSELLREGSGHAVVPRATYRLQFNTEFTFEHAIAIVPYLKLLGVSHVYASPVLQSRSGSAHGYDITDHNKIDPELGGEELFGAFVEELRANGMGIILDFVPNHMGIGAGNQWWRDVLKNGRCSQFAQYFDIDWEPLKPEQRNKVLLPILAAPYGEELESGKLKLELDLRNAELVTAYFEHRFPIALNSVPLIFAGAEGQAAMPAELMARLRELPANCSTKAGEAQRRQQLTPALEADLRAWLATEEGHRAASRAIARLNGKPGTGASFDHLHQLLEAQAYRLAFWRVSGEEINYRRFFDVNDLAGLRQEVPEVFAGTHVLLRRMLAAKQVDGVRIDHVDGLYNPLQYLIRMQLLGVAAEVCGAAPCAPTGENGIELAIQNGAKETQYSRKAAPLYCVVEKILEPGEQLPEEWPVHGTSGYEFLNLVNGIFIDGANAQRFTRIYERFTGLTERVRDLIYSSKKLIMHVAMSSEIYVLSHMLTAISAADRYARDFTPKTLRDAMRETIACFPVYRTYIDERGQYTARDREYVESAIRAAKRRNPGTSGSVFDYLRSVLLLEHKRSMSDEKATREDYEGKLHVALKFQQLTGPVMAKGLEDTVCYVYNRFISANEVGGSPAVFGVSLDDFHAGNRLRASLWPHSMLATSTHDTKRSEDVRARLNVLSEMPTAWSARALKWKRMNKPRRIQLRDGRIVPDPNEEYLLYQTLVGSVPLGLREGNGEVRENFVRRMQQYMNKAAHEAKVNLSWMNDDPEYVHALEEFVASILSGPGAARGESAFVNDLLSFEAEIAYHGALNSLSQTLLKLTVPGVPDIYQGTELFDFSLVDPDNRRAVDYRERQTQLEALRMRAPGAQFCRELLDDIHSGRAKIFVITRALQLRQELAELFAAGDYLPLKVRGERARHVIAFARSYRDEQIVVAVPRFTGSLMRGRTAPPLGEVWGNTALELSEGLYQNPLTGEQLVIRGQLPCRDLFRDFPVALLRGQAHGR